jgi:hypothetical protein
MTQRARAIAILAGVTLVVTGLITAVAVTTRHRQPPPATSPPTTQPAPTAQPAPTTQPAPSSTLPDCTASTGRGPSAFTPHCRGPIVVTVTAVTCLRFVGDGYHLAYTVSNRGQPVDGYVTAQVDDRPPIVAQSTLHLDTGSTFAGQADYPMVSGDGLVVILTTSTGDAIASFPVQTPGCPQNPADVREAEQATTATT